jgi:microcystin-dependent protein
MDWAQIQTNALSGKRLTALSDLSAVLVLSLSGFYRPRHRWNVAGNAPTDSDWDEIEHAISQMEDEIMRGIIGMLLPHALASVSNLDVLACDGASYLRVDYPELYAAIDPVFHIDADNFSVPDLREKFPIGTGGGLSMGDTGGESEHTLSVSEMPTHSHTNAPHSHSEIIAVPSLADLGTGVPVPSATPLAGVTGFSSVVIDNAGGGNPHNNLPPYVAVAWVIVAR